MNAFVEACRREWRRLGVADQVADEMAAELTADLEEAEAEGASAQEVLGSGAFGPRSFAAAWAAERGVIRQPPPGEDTRPRRALVATAIGAFALVAIAGALLVILASPSTPGRLALASPAGPPPGRVWVVVRDVPPALATPDRRIVTAPVPPPGAPILVMADPPAAGARIVAVIDDAQVDTGTVGSVLLTVGLAGVVSLTMFWLWAGPDRRSRRLEDVG